MAHLVPHPTAALKRAQVAPSGTSSPDKDQGTSGRHKRVHHKVKTGCTACKARRHKCEEQKPECAACTRYGTACVYETPDAPRPEIAGPASRSTSVARTASLGPPATALPCSPSPDLELSSLELLHQWLMYTCVAAGQLPEITAYVQVTVPPLAQKFPFVMHGILAMGATHLANVRPARCGHYRLLAWEHHDRGLPDFRSALEHVDERNCQAAISYAKSILWCSLAIPLQSRYASAHAVQETGENWLPQWFRLLRGSCQIVEASRAWIREGPHAVSALPVILPSESRGGEDAHLAALMSVPCSRAESPLFEMVVTSLREAFLRASMDQHNTPLRNGVNFWVSSLPESYIQLVLNNESWTLVVLAHFCILIDRLEASDYSHGHAVHLMRVLMSRLRPEWHGYVQWPCAEMGINCVSWD